MSFESALTPMWLDGTLFFLLPCTLSSFNQGSSYSPTWLDNLQCTGSEARLIDCSRATFEDCSHYEDVGVICLGSFSPVTPTTSSGKQRNRPSQKCSA